MNLRTILLVLVILVAASRSASGQEVKKFELNAVFGWAGQAGGIIKSFGYRLLDGFVLTEANLAIFQHCNPLSANLTLQLPLGPVCPYITAGYGLAFSGFGVSNMAAGLKVWISPNAGLIADVRRFSFTYSGEKTKTTMIGVGFSYRL